MSVPSEEYIFWQNYLAALKTFNSSLLLPESLKIGRGEKLEGGGTCLLLSSLYFFGTKVDIFLQIKYFLTTSTQYLVATSMMISFGSCFCFACDKPTDKLAQLALIFVKAHF